MSNMIRGLAPVHPGEILREDVIPGAGVTKTDFAKHLCISREALNNILIGKSGVSSVMALKLARLLGTTPEFWLNLQQAYDLATVSEEKRKEIECVQMRAYA